MRSRLYKAGLYGAGFAALTACHDLANFEWLTLIPQVVTSFGIHTIGSAILNNSSLKMGLMATGTSLFHNIAEGEFSGMLSNAVWFGVAAAGIQVACNVLVSQEDNAPKMKNA